jgi:hypothetical protein
MLEERTMEYLTRLFALALFLWIQNTSATTLTGDAIVLDPSGFQIATVSINGDLDIDGNTMTVDPFIFFGQPLNTVDVELLSEGTYTRTDGFGGTTTATVNPGQLGGYLVMEWNNNFFGTFMIWDIAPSSDGGSYSTSDSDGDGIPGHAQVSGPFVGATFFYNFTAGEPPPGISVVLNISGGNTQECSETGGSTVTLTATVTLVGGAELGGIDWIVDGTSTGSGETITPFLALGSHTVDVIATAVTGESGTDSGSVDIQDTTDPDLEIAFLNQAGDIVTSTSAGNHVTARLVATDICDPAPVAEGAAVPVFEVADGDVIKLQGGKVNTVELPTTAIELTGSATDTSGNTTSGMAVLSIID